jgi:hypothetical protein
MEKDLADLKAQGALVAESMKAMADSLKGLGAWMPTVDSSISTIQRSIEAMATRVAALEATRLLEQDQTPRPHGRHLQQHTQGTDLDAPRAPDHALVKGKRHVQNTPVHFELGGDSGRNNPRMHDNSRMHDSGYSSYSTYSDRSFSRMPKTNFPRFDGDNPKWWKTVCEKYFTTYDVDREAWANFATLHFHGNAALWLTDTSPTYP